MSYIWLFAWLALSRAAEFTFHRHLPLPPDKDPFYVAPEGFENESPGSPLRLREVRKPPGFRFLDNELCGVYQILYRTTDSHGGPIATVTTLLIPDGANFSRLLSYQIAEDSNFIHCAPSYTTQFRTPPAQSIGSRVEFLLIQAALNQRFVVSVPDYEGPRSAFPAAILEGRAVLDSVRAVLQSRIIDSNARVALWGYSGGSIATGWAAQIRKSYAPELTLEGVVVGGVPANFTALMYTDNGGFFTGFLVAALFGLSEEYPILMEFMENQFSQSTMQHFQRVKRQCLMTEVLSFPFIDFTRLAKSGGEVFEDPILQSVFTHTGMGQACPDMPILLYHSESDEIIPIEPVDHLYETWCGEGADITYRRDVLSEHISELVEGAPEALIWITDRFEGKEVPGGCTRRTGLTNLIDPEGGRIIGKKVSSELMDLLVKLPPQAI